MPTPQEYLTLPLIAVKNQWSDLEGLNEFLCETGSAQHGRSEYYFQAASLYSGFYATSVTVFQLVDLFRELHRLQPFLNYNGNTFALAAKRLIRPVLLNFPAHVESAAESIVGHHVAGVTVLSEEEFMNGLTKLFMQKNLANAPKSTSDEMMDALKELNRILPPKDRK